jgi:nucleotide-binding universal stress UspA family protein
MTIRHLLVCVDFSPLTAAVVEQGVEIARATGAHVRLLHVAAPDPDFVGYGVGPGSVRDAVAHELRIEHRVLEELAERFRAVGVPVTPVMVQGPILGMIVAQARRFAANLVVLGDTGHRMHHVLAGSTAQRVLHDACVPVLLVPSPGFAKTV